MKEESKEIWVTFAGVLDIQIVRRTFELFQGAHMDGIKKAHVLIHSPGGGVSDGVCLYNYFRAIQMEIIAYNAGTVASAATTAYMGASRRIVAPSGTFLIHKTIVPVPNTGSAARLQAAVDAITLDDLRTEAILHEHIKLTDQKWAIHGMADLTLSADESVECGLAHDIGYFTPCGRLFNI